MSKYCPVPILLFNFSAVSRVACFRCCTDWPFVQCFSAQWQQWQQWQRQLSSQSFISLAAICLQPQTCTQISRTASQVAVELLLLLMFSCGDCSAHSLHSTTSRPSFASLHGSNSSSSQSQSQSVSCCCCCCSTSLRGTYFACVASSVID